MIPKIIHYCWLSQDPLPEAILNYIETWKQKLPDYEFMLWNFDLFDKNSSKWVTEAFKVKKYAFAADYIRLYALYNYGGIYMDTDVEVLKSFDPLLQLKTMICFEDFGDRFEMATFGVSKGSEWVKEVLSYYEGRSFIKEDGSYDMKVVPKIVFDVFESNRYQTQLVNKLEDALEVEKSGKIPVFTSDYFSPKSYSTGKITLTENTYSVHHFAGSWLPNYVKWEHKFWNFIGLNDPNLLTSLAKLKRKLFK